MSLMTKGEEIPLEKMDEQGQQVERTEKTLLVMQEQFKPRKAWHTLDLKGKEESVVKVSAVGVG